MRNPLIMTAGGSLAMAMLLVSVAFASFAYQLEVELTIGHRHGNDEEELFGRLEDVEVDESGNIYILDNALHKISVFTATGEHKSTLGRSGEAPGEFDFPTALAIFRNQRIYVADMGHIDSFELPSLEARDEFAHDMPGSIIRSMDVDDQGNLYLVCFERSDQTMIHKYDNRGTPMSSFARSYGFGKDLDVREEMLFAGGYVAVGDGIVTYAQMYPYRVVDYTLNGDTVQTFGRARDFFAPYIYEHGASGQGRSGLPDAVTGVGRLADGSVIISSVRTISGDDANAAISIIDYYAPDGKLSWSVERPGRVLIRCVDDQDDVYAIVEDEYFKVERWHLN